MLEVRERGIRPAQLALTEGESEEHAVVDRSHPTLMLVDRQLEPPGEVRGKSGLDALAGSHSLEENQNIIGITREAMAADSVLHYLNLLIDDLARVVPFILADDGTELEEPDGFGKHKRMLNDGDGPASPSLRKLFDELDHDDSW